MSTVILADTSGSMGHLEGGRRRIDLLQNVLRRVLPDAPGARLVAFGPVPTELRGFEPNALQLPEPAGGTGLHLALRYIAPIRPAQVVVVTDGEPDDAEAALAAARALDCRLVTYFCGNERNHVAGAFLRALAWCSSDGLGRAAVGDLSKPERLTAELRLALAGPGG